MANPIKIAKLVSKQVKKRDAIRTAVRKKSYSAAPTNVKSTTGNKKLWNKVNNLSSAVSNRTGDNVMVIYQKGKIKDAFGNFPPIKTKTRSVTKKAKQMLPSDKKTSKDVNKIIKKRGNAVKPNELLFSKRSVNKVPVKKRGK